MPKDQKKKRKRPLAASGSGLASGAATSSQTAPQVKSHGHMMPILINTSCEVYLRVSDARLPLNKPCCPICPLLQQGYQVYVCVLA